MASSHAEAVREGAALVGMITRKQEESRTELNRREKADLKAQTAAAQAKKPRPAR